MALYLKIEDEFELVSELVSLLSEHNNPSMDIIERSRLIIKHWHAFNLSDEIEDFVRITSIDSQTDHLPKGTARDHWNKEALAVMDEESEEYEQEFMDVFKQSCAGLIGYLCKVDEWEIG